MLALRRKPGEEVFVLLPGGRTARIVLIRQEGRKSVIGFDFPPDCEIVRAEALEDEHASAEDAAEIEASRQHRMQTNV